MAHTGDLLSSEQITGFRARLLGARRALMGDLGSVDEDLRTIEETRELELEERAQEESAADVLARLGEREFEELSEIEDALRRIQRGTYGICTRCAGPIAIERLCATPSASLCSQCVESRDEAEARSALLAQAEEAATAAAAVPPELSSLSDGEMAALVCEHFHDEVGAALQSVRVVCRHGLVMLGGAVASDELRQVALRIVEDEVGLQCVDRMAVGGAAIESTITDEQMDRVLAGGESPQDIFEVAEEGLDYTPPARPVAEK